MLVLNIVARFMVRSPELLGLAPDGDLPPPSPALAGGSTVIAQAVVIAPAPLTGWSLAETWRFPSFWLLAIVFIVMLLSVPVPFVHIVAFARDLGVSSTQGAFAVSIMGLCAFIGSLSLGSLSDRIGRKHALLLSLSMHVIAYGLFVFTKSLTVLYLGAAAFGFFYGSMATLFTALIGDLFGRRHAGAIGGFLFAGAGVLGAWGPMIAGYLRDTTGSYHLAFTYAIATSGVSLLLFAITPKPPPYPTT